MDGKWKESWNRDWYSNREGDRNWDQNQVADYDRVLDGEMGNGIRLEIGVMIEIRIGHWMKIGITVKQS